VSQGGALGVLEAEVRMQEKPLVVLCTRGELEADAMAEETPKKMPAAASCIKCVRVTITARDMLPISSRRAPNIHSSIFRWLACSKCSSYLEEMSGYKIMYESS
jgi:hypothetical protein